MRTPPMALFSPACCRPGRPAPPDSLLRASRRPRRPRPKCLLKPSPLVRGRVLEDRLAGGDSRHYTVSLAAGEFAAVLVGQTGIRLHVAVTCADGSHHERLGGWISACKTGLGPFVRGEGLVGLTRGFLYAGANQIVVSLWSISDQSTARLMTRFYQALLKDKQPPDAALRHAQLALRRNLRYRHPFFWAAFQLHGRRLPTHGR